MNSPSVNLDQVLMRLAALENVVHGLVKAASGPSMPHQRAPTPPPVPAGIQGLKVGTRHPSARRGGSTPTCKIDETLWDDREMHLALAQRDIGNVFRLLNLHGVSQRRIAGLTAQSQSEVSEILNGRKVTSYDVLARICFGLSIPRGHMGLSYDPDTAAFLEQVGEAPAGP